MRHFGNLKTSRRRDIAQLWANVCAAYSQQGNWRAGNDQAFSKALAAFERQFCPENQSKGVVVDFRKRERQR